MEDSNGVVRHSFGRDSKITLCQEAEESIVRFEEHSEDQDLVVEITMPLDGVLIAGRGIFYNVMFKAFEKVMASLSIDRQGDT